MPPLPEGDASPESEGDGQTVEEPELDVDTPPGEDLPLEES